MDAFLETLKNIGPARLALMLFTLFGLFIFFIFIAVRSSAPTMTLLYGDLSASDSTEIAAKLDLSGINYRLSSDGKQVHVVHKEVGRARMLLASEGLPSNGTIGYEIFDKKQSFGTTNFVQNINQLRALEGELARTISTLEAVRTARVHIVLPERELFSRDDRQATASVFVNIRNQSQIGPEQILGMQHLVAAAVPQLKPHNIAIIDANGNLLAKAGEQEGKATTASSATDMRAKYEQRMAQEIEDMLSRIVGHGKVRATVTADLDFNMTTRNAEIYDPEGQVVRSTQNVSEEEIDNTGASANAVTVQNNLPGLPNQGAGDAGAPGSSNTRNEEVVNYEITKTIENTVTESGEVQRLSIAVIIDGKYVEDKEAMDAARAAAEEEGEEVDEETEAEPILKYEPRNDNEMAQIRRLISSAVGLDEDRGDTLEVINMQFAKVEAFENLPDEDTIMGFPKAAIIDMAETATLSIVAILIILLVLRPLIGHLAQSAAATIESAAEAQNAALGALPPGVEAPQLPPPGAEGADAAALAAGTFAGTEGEGSELDSMLDMSQVEGRVKASSIQKVSDLIDSHPNETVAVIRNWMSQEG